MMLEIVIMFKRVSKLKDFPQFCNNIIYLKKRKTPLSPKSFFFSSHSLVKNVWCHHTAACIMGNIILEPCMVFFAAYTVTMRNTVQQYNIFPWLFQRITLNIMSHLVPKKLPLKLQKICLKGEGGRKKWMLIFVCMCFAVFGRCSSHSLSNLVLALS